MTELRLEGCRSRPLLGYLKALGAFRLIAGQVDSAARARWAHGVLELDSELDQEAVREFFLTRYRPSPILSPWNGRSGFYAKRNASMEAIKASADERLDTYRAAFARAEAVIARLGLTSQPREGDKGHLVAALRNELPDEAIDWLDAAVVVVGGDLRFPPLLASGGADGSYDFSKNFADALVQAIAVGERPPPLDRRSAWLDAALHSSSAPLVAGLSGGQFHRDASPVNSPHGEDEALGNPWDIVLAIEGAPLLAPGAARRHESSLPGGLVAPFTARSTGAGYGSAVNGEKGRAELWLPLWSGWASIAELETVVREARAQVGRRTAHTGFDFVRAAGELGVARGIESFERFAILERAGQSGLAVPAGRIAVRRRGRPARAIAEIAPWFDRVKRARDRLPTRPQEAVTALERALFEFADAGTPAAACTVVERLGQVETALAAGAARAKDAGLRPLAGAKAGPWLAAADDGSVEFVLAAAFASLHDRGSLGLPAIRDYLHGTALERSGVHGPARDEHHRRVFASDVREVIPRRADPVLRLAEIHARRHIDARSSHSGGLPSGNGSEPSVLLTFSRGLECPRAAAHAFLTPDGVDRDRMLRLVEGLALLSFDGRSWSFNYRSPPGAPPVPSFDLLALAWTGPEGTLQPRPGWAAALAANRRDRVEAVIADATLRLRMAELTPVVEPADLMPSVPPGREMCAALLLQLSRSDREAITDRMIVRHDAVTEGAILDDRRARR